MVAVTIVGKYAYVANVGDSRLYVIHDEITQITIDHSLVEEMVRRGTIGKVEARNHPDKNIITRAVGVNSQVEVDLFRVELMPGDLILMCSDGLSDLVTDQQIAQTVTNAANLDEACNILIGLALKAGGKDNVTVVTVGIEQEDPGICPVFLRSATSRTRCWLLPKGSKISAPAGADFGIYPCGGSLPQKGKR